MPNHLKDISGQKFGRWTVSKHVGNGRWECKCECGNTVQVIGMNLKNGSSTSCGCLRRELQSAISIKTNTKHGMWRTPEYKAWAAMRSRCLNRNNRNWHRYGGRGVHICAEWESFDRFFQDMGPRPSDKHSLDRADNGLLYSKATCRWATPSEQCNNTRRNRRITYQGRTMTLAEWARTFGAKDSIVRGRIRMGWNIEEAIRGRLS